jgi:hypothetical protein
VFRLEYNVSGFSGFSGFSRITRVPEDVFQGGRISPARVLWVERE